MQLIGYMDSPYVRRVAITAQFLGVPYEHRELSIFRDFDEFSAINPLVKVPTWVCDDGQVLVESGLIIDYLESRVGRGRLMPSDEAGYIRALRITGTAMVLNEKAVQLIYELKHRPEALQHAPWIDRIQTQFTRAAALLEAEAGDGSSWMFGEQIMEPDIAMAIAWRFTQLHFPERLPAMNYPGLVALSARAESLPEFEACPIG
jgi:glutathione S-transferase